MNPHPFQTAILNPQSEAREELLAPSVQLHSPVLRHPLAGRELVAPLLGELRACFTEPVFTDTLQAPETLGLVFRAKIADLDAEGLQLLRFDSDGLIEDITVMLRPIRAAMALAQAMGPIQERQADGSYALPTPRP